MNLEKKYKHGYTFFDIIKYYCKNPYLNFDYNLYVNKHLVKSVVKDIINVAETFYYITKIEEFDKIDFDRLPDKFIIKPASGSGIQHIVYDKSKIDKNEIKDLCEEWLNIIYGNNMIANNPEEYFESHYLLVEQGVLFEEYLGDKLVDYKFNVIHGNIEFITFEMGTDSVYSDKEVLNLYDLDWKYVNAYVLPEPEEIWYSDRNHPSSDKPKNLKQLIKLAYTLSECLGKTPYMRIDLYNINGVPYFGEFTPTPGAGCIAYPKDRYVYDWNKYYGSLIDFHPDRDKLEQVVRYFR